MKEEKRNGGVIIWKGGEFLPTVSWVVMGLILRDVREVLVLVRERERDCLVLLPFQDVYEDDAKFSNIHLLVTKHVSFCIVHVACVVLPHFSSLLSTYIYINQLIINLKSTK